MNTLDHIFDKVEDTTIRLMEPIVCPKSIKHLIRNLALAALMGSAIGALAGSATNPDTNITEPVENIIK